MTNCSQGLLLVAKEQGKRTEGLDLRESGFFFYHVRGGPTILHPTCFSDSELCGIHAELQGKAEQEK